MAKLVTVGFSIAAIAVSIAALVINLRVMAMLSAGN